MMSAPLFVIIRAREHHVESGAYPACPLGPSDEQGFDDWSADVVERYLEERCCIYPGCENTRRTRGLCHGHYQAMRSKVRAGKADEEDLQERGLLMAAGTGGSSVNGHSAFLKGSTVKGRA